MIQITCPSCAKRFRSDVDLTGKTVKCGACQEKFTVTADLVNDPAARKSYPGEKNTEFFNRLGTTETARADQPAMRPNFQPASPAAMAAAAQPHTVDDVLPASPMSKVAVSTAIVLMMLFLMLLLFGVGENGMLENTPVSKRIVVGAFGAVLVTALTTFAAKKNRFKGLLGGLTLGLPLVVVAAAMPAPDPLGGAGDGGLADEEAPVEQPLTDPVDEREGITALKDRVGYSLVQRRIDVAESNGDSIESIYAVYVTGAQSRQRRQIQDYLERVTGAATPPLVVERDAINGNYLYAGGGSSTDFNDIVRACELIGIITGEHEELRLIELQIKQETFQQPDQAKLTDTTHPAFYEVNLSELRSIDSMRIEKALRRLTQVPPARNRAEVNDVLIQLASRAKDFEQLEYVAKCMTNWATEADLSGAALVAGMRRIQNKIKLSDIPYEVVEFVALKNYEGGYPLLMEAWEGDPLTYEPLLTKLGAAAEGLVRPYLKSEEGRLQQAAVAALESVGSDASLPDLRALQAKVNAEFATRIRISIEAIEQR